MKAVRTVAIAIGIASATFVGLIVLSLTLDCNGESKWTDYLHRQSTPYISDGEPRWGRLP